MAVDKRKVPKKTKRKDNPKKNRPEPRYKINYGDVVRLKNWRVEQGCKLVPKNGVHPCTTCLNFEKCKDLERERAYILSEEAVEAETRRRVRRIAAQEQKTVKKEDKSSYPCEPFDEVCPNQATCQEGIKCPWKNQEA